MFANDSLISAIVNIPMLGDMYIIVYANQLYLTAAVSTGLCTQTKILPSYSNHKNDHSKNFNGMRK